MTGSQVTSLPFGSAQHVVAHARRQNQRGRRPSMPFGKIRNPKEALAAAQAQLANDIADTEPFEDPTYELHVVCFYRNEVKREGSLVQKKYASDKMALRWLKVLAKRELFPRFDQVYCIVREGDREVGSFTLLK